MFYKLITILMLTLSCSTSKPVPWDEVAELCDLQGNCVCWHEHNKVDCPPHVKPSDKEGFYSYRIGKPGEPVFECSSEEPVPFNEYPCKERKSD